AVVAQYGEVDAVSCRGRTGPADQGGRASAELQRQRNLARLGRADGVDALQRLTDPVTDGGGKLGETRQGGGGAVRTVQEVADEDGTAQAFACQRCLNCPVEICKGRHRGDPLTTGPASGAARD